MLKDKWEATSYVALNYGKYLGNYWDNGTYSYYQIKGLSTEEWIYEGYGAVVPPNYWESTVYRRKGKSIEPIEQWNVNKILISSNPDIQQGKVNYTIEGEITEKIVISTLLNSLNGEHEEENVQDLKILDSQLLFVFDECPDLAWQSYIYYSENQQYFIMKNDKYYSASCLKNYIKLDF